jgi:ubiquitin carboxyl-terminal hydrolase 4/11/15
VNWFARANDRLIAFEVDDTTKLWVPCVFKMRTGLTDAAGREEAVLPPFLVPVENEKAEASTIGEVASEMLAWMWDLTERAQAWKSPHFAPKSSQAINRVSNTRVIAAFDRGWNRLNRDPAREFLSLTAVAFTVNPKFVEGFNIDAVAARVDEMRTKIGAMKKCPSKVSGITLVKCLESFNKSETLDGKNKWYCGHCKEFVCAEKTLEIWCVPTVLIVQLKRFVNSGYNRGRLDDNVDYPDVLGMRPYVVGPVDGKLKYRLFAVSEHSGSLAGGHYTAHAIVRENEQNDGEWYDFNDSSCRVASAASAHSVRAYLLFYEMIDEAQASQLIPKQNTSQGDSGQAAAG